jgi:hypothetical protein
MARDTNDHKLQRRNPAIEVGAVLALSQADINLNAELGHNATHVTVINDTETGSQFGNIQLSYNGVDFSTTLPILGGETMEFFDLDVHTIRLIGTEAGGDWSYRVVAS